MARIFQTGFEAAPNFHPWCQKERGGNDGTLPVASTTMPRSGAYSLMMNITGTWGGSSWLNVNIPNSTEKEMFFRVAHRVTSVGASRAIYVFSDAIEIARVTIGTTTCTLHILGGDALTYTYPAEAGTNWHLFELHVKMDAVDGLVELKYDGAKALSWTGNTQGTGTVITQLRLYGNKPSLGTACVCYWDDVAINDTTGPRNNSWCGDGYIKAIHPSGVGDSSQWIDQDGNQTANWAAVDDATADDDTTYVKTNSPDLVDLYALDNVALPEGHVLNTVTVTALARLEVAGEDRLHIGYKLDLSEVWEDMGKLTTAYSPYATSVLELAPDGTPWNETKLNNLQVGVKATEG